MKCLTCRFVFIGVISKKVFTRHCYKSCFLLSIVVHRLENTVEQSEGIRTAQTSEFSSQVGPENFHFQQGPVRC